MKALCLACGAFKYGALAACRACGHHPSDPEDQARHLIVGEGDVEEAAAQHSTGSLTFDAEAVEEARALLEAHPVAPLGYVLLVAMVPAVAVLGVVLILLWAGWAWSG